MTFSASAALHIAVGASLIAWRAGATPPRAVLTGGAAAATALTVYFTAVAAYAH